MENNKIDTTQTSNQNAGFKKVSFAAWQLQAAQRAEVAKEEADNSARATLQLVLETIDVQKKAIAAGGKAHNDVTLLFVTLYLNDWFIYGRLKDTDVYDVIQLKQVLDVTVATHQKIDLNLSKEAKSTLRDAHKVVTDLYNYEEKNKAEFEYSRQGAQTTHIVVQSLLNPMRMLDCLTLDNLLRALALYQKFPGASPYINNYAVCPFLYVCYQAETNPARKKRLLAKNIDRSCVILIPIYQDTHWTCLFYDSFDDEAYYLDGLHCYRDSKPDALAKVKTFVEDLRVHCRNLRNDDSAEDSPAKFVDVVGRQQTNAVDGGFYVIDAMMTFFFSPRDFIQMVRASEAGIPAETSHPVDASQVRSACVTVLQEVAQAKTYRALNLAKIKFCKQFDRTQGRRPYLALSAGPAKRQKM